MICLFVNILYKRRYLLGILFSKLKFFIQKYLLFIKDFLLDNINNMNKV